MKYSRIKSKYRKKKSFWETKTGEFIGDSVCKFAEIVTFPFTLLENVAEKIFYLYDDSDFYKRRRIEKVKKENLRNVYESLAKVLRNENEVFFIVKNKDKVMEVSNMLLVNIDFTENTIILKYIDYSSSWMLGCFIRAVPKFNGVEDEIESPETTMRIILESLQSDRGLHIEEVAIVGVEQGSIYSIREKQGGVRDDRL